MESSSRTLVCSVLFLDIVEYSRKPVAEQLQLKQLFNAVLAKALDQVAAPTGIISRHRRRRRGHLHGRSRGRVVRRNVGARHGQHRPVRLGVNLGPVRLGKKT